MSYRKEAISNEKNTGDTTIRVFFKWNDDATNNMNNTEDTEYATGSENPDAKIKVTLKFTQKK